MTDDQRLLLANGQRPTTNMQFTKDSFYLTLRTRLAALDPSRLISVDGVPMIAILVAENSPAHSEKYLPDTYYLSWGACRPIPSQPHPLFALDCTVSYWTAGATDSGVDRGRALAQLDTELIAICHPQSTAKQDFTQSPSADLGTSIFWTAPELKQGGFDAPSRALCHTASLTVFFSPEAGLS